MRDRGIHVLSVCATLALLFTGHLAFGQTADSSADDEPIEEIIVTALKRETKLLETPLAVSAFTGDELERIGADGLEEFLQFAPGVSFDRSVDGQQRIYIRGLASIFGNSPIGFYIDEVPFTALTVTLTPDLRAWDLERVEVLRGPQGTLYGASSLGGTIRTLTNDPVHNEFQAKVDLSYSDTDDGGNNQGLKAAVNIPLIDDTLSLRLAATDEAYDGWIDSVKPLTGVNEDDLNEFDVTTARAKLLWTVTDRADVVLGWWNTDSKADAGNLADDTFSTNNLLNPHQTLDVESNLFSAKVTVDLDWATLTSSTSVLDYESGTDFVDFAPGFSTTDIEITSQEFRLTSDDDGDLFWNVGLIYIDNETFIDFFFNLPGFFVNQSTQDNDSESYAVYGEVTYALTDTLDATFGLRYYNDEVTRNDTQFLVAQPEIENKYIDWSPRFNLAWNFDEGRLLYGTISKGFRSGLTQPSIALAAAGFIGIGIDDGVDSEDAWNYEIGTKLVLADGKVTFDAVAYYIDWSDLQAQVLLNPVVFAFVNAGDAEGMGLEVVTSWRATDNLTFTVSGNINDTTYSDTVTDTFGRVIFDDGDQLQFVPEYTVTAAVDYMHPFDNGWRAVARASVEAVGDRSTTDDSLTSVDGDSSTRFNLRVGAENNTWGIYLFAENLGDDDNRINPAGTALARGYASRYRPRTIGLNLRFDY